MAGGGAEEFAAAEPLLDAMGRKAVPCGAAGAGQAAKICHNMILAVSMIGVSEAFVLAESLGLDHQALYDVASTASGQRWALTGGGCELAMLCDILLAADTAKFGQPEIKLGVIPGIGGSQRLTRAVGKAKAKAMELCLTGRTMDAVEAERAGLVSRILSADELLAEALAVATTVAEMSKPVAMMDTEAVNRAFETTLTEGVRFERRLFHAVFATADQKEGMSAFADKRPPHVTHG